MSAPKYKKFVEDHILTEDERAIKGYLPRYNIQPARGRIPEKYYYYKEVVPKNVMNTLTGVMATTTFFNGIPPAHPLSPPPRIPSNQPFVLQPATLIIGPKERRNINASVRAALYRPPPINPYQNNNMGGIVGRLEGVHMTDGGRRRKSRRNLKKTAKKTYRRRK